ncbi:hypothetical protein GIB67_006063 [Kingdonia uniflora]|uniref:3'-5' exonuclease domain-containing protein n=1 Tax=Kingdonia uniflora TaxID=39325 RepID=A0A7J7LPH5_9MAGN|nr:hypothetical protein GIB67_006063 [Kingdonia uniflora]
MSTSSSLVQQVYDITFNDTYHHIITTVTHVPSVADAWIKEIKNFHRSRLHKLIVGLDIEWCPNNRYSTNPVAILQLCVGKRCLIFQLLYAVSGLPGSVERFLLEECYTFVGIGIKDDVFKLESDYNWRVSNAVDLRDLAIGRYNEKWLKNVGLKSLAKEVLGIELEKPKYVARSNWAVPYLSDEQVEYATVDAFVSFEIGRILMLD